MKKPDMACTTIRKTPLHVSDTGAHSRQGLSNVFEPRPPLKRQGKRLAPGCIGLCPPPVSHRSSPGSMLCQEWHEHLVKCRRILKRHRVCGIGNGHGAAAGQAPHNNLIDQRKVARRLCPAHDERGGLHAAQGGAGDRWRRRRGQ